VEQFGSFLENYDWSAVFSNKGLDGRVDAFLHSTKVIINKFFPERIIKLLFVLLKFSMSPFRQRNSLKLGKNIK
jgi:hypothetical protein